MSTNEPGPQWLPPTHDAALVIVAESPQGSTQSLASRRTDRQPFRWNAGWTLLTVIVLVLALVAGFGGFKYRTDSRVDVAPGTTVDIGMAEFRVIRAIAEETSDPDRWQLTVLAEVRNLTEQPIGVIDFEYALGLGYTNSEGEFIAERSLSLDFLVNITDEKASPRYRIPPQTDVVPVIIHKYVNDGFDLDSEFVVFARPVVYRTNTVLNLSSEKVWATDLSRSVLWVYTPEIEVRRYEGY
ncbi:MAG: hypothetical protein FWG08_00710 [Propionibacteriaceae bacterium]|nr:hypothetical protein [Propionibacteriaceae bacterium]